MDDQHAMPDGTMMAGASHPQPTAPTPEAAPMQPQGPGNEGADDIPNVSPEEQKQYDTVFAAALDAIYDKDRITVILHKLLSGSEKPGESIGHTAAMIMTSLKGAVQEKNGQISDDIMFAVGQDVIGELCQIAVASKLIKESEINNVANTAMFEGMRTWGEQMEQNGELTEDMQSIAKQDLADHGITMNQQQGQQQAPAPEQQPQPPQGGIVQQAMGA